MPGHPGSDGAGPPRHLRRIVWAPRHGPDLSRWPFTLPAVRQLVDDGGLDMPAGVTVLVGENGSGKSTLVEAFAAVYPRAGARTSRPAEVDVTGPGPSDEDSPLRWHLRADTHPMAAPGGFFLRAELMHSYLTGIDADPDERRAWAGEHLQGRSHGESFLAVLRHRFNDRGVYFLDEPESALSFRSCLALVSLLDVLRQEGSQAVVATHSPLIASLPGATLLELGEWGIRQAAYDELELVQSWREFLAAPGRWLRHLVDVPE